MQCSFKLYDKNIDVIDVYTNIDDFFMLEMSFHFTGIALKSNPSSKKFSPRTK